MKLTYWHAPCLNDSRAYSVRARTKKSAKAIIAYQGSENFGELEKVTVEYIDGFDLMDKCSNEDSSWWESY